MTSIEERLLQDIEAVTGGLVSTEQDLREARGDLERRIDVRRQADRRRVAVGAVAASTAMVVGLAAWQVQGDDKEHSPVGPVTGVTETSESEEEFLAGDPPTTDQLLGVWQAHTPARRGILWKFTADGVVALGFAGSVAEDPAVHGTFEISEDAVVVEIDDDVTLCQDKSWTLRAAVNEDGGLNVVPRDVDVADMCGTSAPPRWVLDRVLPVPGGGELPEVPAGDDFGPPPNRKAVVGAWSDPAGGYIVELRWDGTYTMLTGAAEKADRGTWTVGDAATRLTLVSAADSPTCSEGDQLVLSNLRLGQVGELVLQGDPERNDCQVPFDGTGWFRLG